MKKNIGLLFLVFWFCGTAKGQVTCPECGAEYWIEPVVDTVLVHDTVKIRVSTLDDVTKTFGMTFDEFTKEFLLKKEKEDSVKEYSPEIVYLNYLLPILQREPENAGGRMISTIFTFDVAKQPKVDVLKLSDSVSVEKLDIVFRCGNSTNIDYFVTSPRLVDKALVELFGYIARINRVDKKIRGINFDFSEFQFREKRAMAQFAKSVSMVMDSIHLKSLQGLRLYFSFDKALGEGNRNFLCAVAQMVDSVFLLEKGNLNPAAILTAKDGENISLPAKFFNQFYLARFSLSGFPVQESEVFSADEVKALAHSDYPDNNWESYLFILVGIILLICIVWLLYWLLPSFSYYLDQNRDYLFMLVLMSGFEVFLLFMAMVEAMSREDVLNLSGSNKNLLLFMPLVFVFVIPMIKMISYRKDKP